MKKQNDELSKKVGKVPQVIQNVQAVDEDDKKIDEGIKVGGKVQVTLHCD